jgi:hypothetical protein
MPVTISWHDTTLGSGASVPTVNTEAWALGAGEELLVPPQLESKTAANNEANTPIPLRFNINFLLILGIR